MGRGVGGLGGVATVLHNMPYEQTYIARKHREVKIHTCTMYKSEKKITGPPLTANTSRLVSLSTVCVHDNCWLQESSMIQCKNVCRIMSINP